MSFSQSGPRPPHGPLLDAKAPNFSSSRTIFAYMLACNNPHKTIYLPTEILSQAQGEIILEKRRQATLTVLQNAADLFGVVNYSKAIICYGDARKVYKDCVAEGNANPAIHFEMINLACLAKDKIQAEKAFENWLASTHNKMTNEEAGLLKIFFGFSKYNDLYKRVTQHQALKAADEKHLLAPSQPNYSMQASMIAFLNYQAKKELTIDESLTLLEELNRDNDIATLDKIFQKLFKLDKNPSFSLLLEAICILKNFQRTNTDASNPFNAAPVILEIEKLLIRKKIPVKLLADYLETIQIKLPLTQSAEDTHIIFDMVDFIYSFAHRYGLMNVLIINSLLKIAADARSHTLVQEIYCYAENHKFIEKAPVIAPSLVFRPSVSITSYGSAFTPAKKPPLSVIIPGSEPVPAEQPKPTH